MNKPYIAMRMQIPPLMPDRLRTDKGVEVALRIARRDLMRRLKAKLGQTGFSKRAKAAFQKAMKIEVKPSSLVVTVNHPAFEAHVRGRRRKQMTWLKQARRPIPIITEEGELIFRTAHARSLTWTQGPMTGPNVGAKKGWKHPGRPPEDFVEQAKTMSRTFLKEKLRKSLVAEMRKAVKSKRR